MGLFDSIMNIGTLGLYGDITGTDPSNQAANAASQQLQAQQQNLTEQLMLNQGNSFNILGGQNTSRNALNTGLSSATGTLGAQYGNAIGATNTGYGNALGALGSQYGNAIGTLGTAFGNATGTLAPLTGTATLAGNVAAPIGQGFTSSPGYQFALQQGENAINANASAGGGRNSGATDKALASYATGMANQEYQNFVNNQLAQRGQELGAAGLGYGAAGQLGNLFAQQGQGAAGLYTGLGQGQAGLYGAQAGTLGNLYTGLGNTTAGMQYGTGQAQSNLAQAGVMQQLGNSAMLGQAYNNYAQYPGMVAQSQANSGNQTQNAILGFGSNLLGKALGGR